LLNRRTVVSGAVWIWIGTRARAADGSARDFLAGIYGAYRGKNAKGRPLADERTIRRYFEPSLAAMVVKDRKDAARRKEVGTLDFDPFVDAQDWDIAAFDIAVGDEASGKANATVKFVNAGTPNTVVLDLVRTAGGWRISDITWQREDKSETLRALFAVH
jgi:hypothetical protein